MKPSRCRGVVPGQRGIHHPVISYRQVMQAKLVCPCDVLIDSTYPIKERELRMEMKVRKLGHGDVLSLGLSLA